MLRAREDIGTMGCSTSVGLTCLRCLSLTAETEPYGLRTGLDIDREDAIYRTKTKDTRKDRLGIKLRT